MDCTVGEVLRRHFADYAARRRVPRHHWRAAGALSRCRTAALGGHVRRCANGHLDGVWYNSCHHRWCPRCNGLVGERWLERQRSRLLPCAHRHLVFTLPSELRGLFRGNEALLSEALFGAVSETLLELSADPRHLGGRPGAMLARHTWGRSLSYHPHLHCLVSEGGVDAHGEWKAPRRRCFLPARVVMQVYRGKYLARLRGLLESGALRLAAGQSEQRLASELNRLGRIDWNVRVGERYGHGVGVATYLARYLRGGPIRNRQLRRRADGRIELRYRSHRHAGARRVQRMRLEPAAFIARYLAHVPQPRRRTLRSYGLYASSAGAWLARARAALGEQNAPAPETKLQWPEYLRRISAVIPACRICGAPVALAEELPRGRGPP